MAYVTTSFTKEPAALSNSTFNIPLILTSVLEAPSVRVSTYSTLKSIGEDFDSTSKAYIAASKLLLADKPPSTVLIGRRGPNNKKTYEVEIQTAQSGIVYSVTVEGYQISYTSDETATKTEIVAGLKAALNAASSVNPTILAEDGSSSAKLKITGKVSGFDYSLSSSDGGTGSATVAVLTLASGDLSFSSAMDDVRKNNDGFFQFICTDNDKATQEGLAAWSQINNKLYITCTDSQEVLSSSITTDIATKLKDLNYSRAALIWSHQSGRDYTGFSITVASNLATFEFDTPGTAKESEISLSFTPSGGTWGQTWAETKYWKVTINSTEVTYALPATFSLEIAQAGIVSALNGESAINGQIEAEAKTGTNNIITITAKTAGVDFSISVISNIDNSFTLATTEENIEVIDRLHNASIGDTLLVSGVTNLTGLNGSHVVKSISNSGKLVTTTAENVPDGTATGTIMLSRNYGAPDAGICGLLSGYDPDNTSFTLAHKKMNGITPSNAPYLSETKTAVLRSKNVIYYSRVDDVGLSDIINNPKTLSGDWIDSQVTLLWLTSRINTALSDFLLKNQMITYDDTGISSLENVINQWLEIARIGKHITALPGDPLTNPDTKPYLITLPAFSAIPGTIVESRELKGISVTCKLMQKIHKITLSGRLLN